MTDKIEGFVEAMRERAVSRRRAGQFAFADELEQAAEALAALRTQRDEVIEECARVADGMGDGWHREWRADLKASTHLEGKSDGADEIATAIRNLKSMSATKKMQKDA